MGAVTFSKKYINRVIDQASKISENILFFKVGDKDDEIAITAMDKSHGAKVCIKAQLDNINFEGKFLSVHKISALKSNLKMVNYPGDPDASIDRREVKSLRNLSYDVLDLKGSLGTFTMQCTAKENFDKTNMMIIDDGYTDSAVRAFARLHLSIEELKNLQGIATRLIASKFFVKFTTDGIELYIRGDQQQYSQFYGLSKVEYEDSAASQIIDDGTMLGFNYKILDLAKQFEDNFVFEFACNSSKGIYAVKGFGGYENSVQELHPEDGSPIKYIILGTYNPSQQLSGTGDSDILMTFQ